MGLRRTLKEAVDQTLKELIDEHMQPAIDLGNRLVAQGEALQKKLVDLDGTLSAAYTEAIETIHRECDTAIAAIRAASRPPSPG